jgi:hypothetical protein
MYSPGFGVTLVALTMITAFVIPAVSGSIILALGMAGVLSVVRFPAAAKEPLDAACLFWSIAAGVVAAAGLIPMCVFGSAFIGVMLLIFVNRKSRGTPYILILRCDNMKTELCAKELLAAHVTKLTLKSKSVSGGGIELNYEVLLEDGDTDFVNHILEADGVSDAVLVSYNGEYVV